jgi:hypothetical protein
MQAGMAYKVFISHSTRDQGLVTGLANMLNRYGVDVLVAEWYLQPGQPVATKILQQIKSADCVVVFLTRDGIRSGWVQQEIAAALGSHRLLVPLAEKGTPARELAALQGLEWIEYDPSSPQQALVRASSYVHALRLKKEQREKALLVTGGILAFLLLLSCANE